MVVEPGMDPFMFCVSKSKGPHIPTKKYMELDQNPNPKKTKKLETSSKPRLKKRKRLGGTKTGRKGEIQPTNI